MASQFPRISRTGFASLGVVDRTRIFVGETTRKSPAKVAGAVSANVPFPVVELRAAKVPVMVCAEELPPDALWS